MNPAKRETITEEINFDLSFITIAVKVIKMGGVNYFKYTKIILI